MLWRADPCSPAIRSALATWAICSGIESVSGYTIVHPRSARRRSTAGIEVFCRYSSLERDNQSLRPGSGRAERPPGTRHRRKEVGLNLVADVGDDQPLEADRSSTQTSGFRSPSRSRSSAATIQGAARPGRRRRLGPELQTRGSRAAASRAGRAPGSPAGNGRSRREAVRGRWPAGMAGRRRPEVAGAADACSLPFSVARRSSVSGMQAPAASNTPCRGRRRRAGTASRCSSGARGTAAASNRRVKAGSRPDSAGSPGPKWSAEKKSFPPRCGALYRGGRRPSNGRWRTTGCAATAIGPERPAGDFRAQQTDSGCPAQERTQTCRA